MVGKKILLTGSGGQIGTVLVSKLRELYGNENIIATDLKENPANNILPLDVLNKEEMGSYIEKNNIKIIFHLAAILSASGEKNPKKAWDINMNGYFNVLENAVQYGVEKVFYPSTIAVFGKEIPLKNTPNYVPLIPATVYGISKVSGELWSQYYFDKFGLDIRSIRYPGVIGHQSLPGGGTTDYAVDIFYSEAKGETFNCFLEPNTVLPMIFMDDCIKATIDLMNAPKENLTCRTSYNVAGMSFSPEEIASAIQKVNPEFKIEYHPDYRQEIASSWPQSIDDSLARKDWGWKPEYNLEKMVEVMTHEVRKKSI